MTSTEVPARQCVPKMRAVNTQAPSCPPTVPLPGLDEEESPSALFPYKVTSYMSSPTYLLLPQFFIHGQCLIVVMAN